MIAGGGAQVQMRRRRKRDCREGRNPVVGPSRQIDEYPSDYRCADAGAGTWRGAAGVAGGAERGAAGAELGAGRGAAGAGDAAPVVPGAAAGREGRFKPAPAPMADAPLPAPTPGEEP